MLEATPVGGEETKTRPKTRIHTGTMNVRLSKMAIASILCADLDVLARI